MREYLVYGLAYVKRWGAPVIPADADGRPLVAWRRYAESGMTEAEYRKLFDAYIARGKRRVLRLTVATGLYQLGRTRRLVILDFDLVKGDRLETAKRFAELGYPTVLTPRGLHVAAATRDDIYALMLHYEDVDGDPVRAGEGASLQPHLWTMPPSKRWLDEDRQRLFIYSFVARDGSTVASVDELMAHPEVMELPLVTLRELAADVELVTGARLSHARPAADRPAPRSIQGVPGGSKLGVFHDIDELLYTAPSTTLPACIAHVLYAYYTAVGDTWKASILRSVYGVSGVVPHGSRFVVSAAFTLFAAHVVDFVKLDEIYEVLSVAVEDWPVDEGQSLDKKLAYLVLVDEQGYIYPRYSGLGPMCPLNAGYQLCQRCPFRHYCRCAPWYNYYRLPIVRAISLKRRAARIG